MSKSLRTPMIVLRATKYGEADLIVQGLTPAHGKVSAIARAALKSKKRFGGGVLEPTHHIDVQLKLETQGERLSVLEEAKLIHDFSGLRSQYERLEAALAVVRAVDRVSHEGDVHLRSLYDLTGHALSVLSQCNNISQFKVHFALRLLLQQGVLEHDAWMGIFLATPMAESNTLTAQVSSQQMNWIETQLENYLTRAES